MGDFSQARPTHTAFSKLRALGVTHVIAGNGVFTTLGSTATHVGANWYDNIWIDRQYSASASTPSTYGTTITRSIPTWRSGSGFQTTAPCGRSSRSARRTTIDGRLAVRSHLFRNVPARMRQEQTLERRSRVCESASPRLRCAGEVADTIPVGAMAQWRRTS